MLRTISRVVFHPRKLTDLKWNGKVKIFLQAQTENLRVVSSATLQTNVKEENYSLSQKVLEYMRGNYEYASSLMPLSHESNVSNSAVQIFRRQQLAHALAHTVEPKPDDILEVFSHYALEEQNIIQDIINKKNFMLIIRERVFQVIPLMTQDELKKFASILRKLNFERSRYLISLVEKLGQECVDRAAEADLEQSLDLFDIMILLHENRVYKRRQFDTFISFFESHLSIATPHQLVQILHYIGIAKKHKLNQESVQLIITKLEEVINNLSFIDIGIAVGGMFKCSVKLDKSSPIIHKTAECLQIKLKNSKRLTDLEYFTIVAMIKVLRTAKYNDQALLSSISSFVMRCDVDTLDYTVIAHVLSLFANLQVYDPQVFTKVEQLMLHNLNKHTVAVRVKDISKVMWSFSHVGHQITNDFFCAVEKVLLKILQMGKLDRYPEHLSSSLFSMAVMEHYPYELIKEAFHPHRTIKLKGYQRSKHLSRLVALHQAVKIEAPNIDVSLPEISLSDLPKRTLADEMLYRHPLTYLKKGADFINKSIGSSVLELKFPLPLINYASLVFDTRRLKKSSADGNLILQQLLACKSCVGDRSIAIDLVDSQSLLVGCNDVIGIVRMKLRLMTKNGWLVQRIYEDDINKFNIDEHTMGALILDVLSKFQK